jgi:replicative DNA helicase
MTKKSVNAPLQDAGLERSVLSGILCHGPDCLLDAEEVLSVKDFYWSHNQVIFKILQQLVHDQNVKEFDIPSILGIAKTHSYQIFEKEEKTAEYIEALLVNSISHENTLNLVACIRKLSIARKAITCLDKSKKDLLAIRGSENINDIITKIEKPVFQFTGDIISDKHIIQPICNNLLDTLKTLAEDKKDLVGLSTGFPKWDLAVGGGLRRGTVNILGARPKIGKSFFCLNVGEHVASNGVPVLYLDTELSHELQKHRFISLMSGVSLDRLETGRFADREDEKKRIWQTRQSIQETPLTHCSIAGQSIKIVTSIVRRWLSKYVGFNDQGKANPCLLIYDYVKLTNLSDINDSMREYQLIGFLMSALHDFALQWGIPVLAAVQLNREGVKKEGGEFAAGSDRILWLCSTFTILKDKTSKERALDPPSNGTKKLVITDTRFGPGIPDGEYINVIDKLSCSRLAEGRTYYEVVKDPAVSNESYQTDE